MKKIVKIRTGGQTGVDRAVIVIMHTQHYVMLQRNLLYTALTRGRKLVLLIGVPYAVDQAIKTNAVRERRTALAALLSAPRGREDGSPPPVKSSHAG